MFERGLAFAIPAIFRLTVAAGLVLAAALSGVVIAGALIGAAQIAQMSERSAP